MDQIWQLLDSAPEPLKTWAGSALLIGAVAAAALSKTAAESWGRLGTLARSLRRLRREAVEKDQAASEKRVSLLESRVEALELESAKTHRWVLWVTFWGRDVEITAAKHGLRLPRFMDREEWGAKGEPDYE